MNDRPAKNTDVEIWRGPSRLENPELDPDRFYADSIHVTEGGGIGFNCGGMVIVRPAREWYTAMLDKMGGPHETIKTRPSLVVLDDCEMAMARACGAWRLGRVRREGLGESGNKGMHRDLPGAVAEMAVAKWAGVYWGGGSDIFAGADVAGFQVRSTTHRTGHLIIFDSERDEVQLLLVLVDQNRCTIVGTITAAEGRRVGHPPGDKARPGSPPQVWVPQVFLQAVA